MTDLGEMGIFFAADTPQRHVHRSPVETSSYDENNSGHSGQSHLSTVAPRWLQAWAIELF